MTHARCMFFKAHFWPGVKKPPRSRPRRRHVEGLSTGSWPCACAHARRSSAPCRRRTGAASCRLVLPRIEPVYVCSSTCIADGSMCGSRCARCDAPGSADSSGRCSALIAMCCVGGLFLSLTCTVTCKKVRLESTDRIRTLGRYTGRCPSEQQVTLLRAVTQSKLIYTPPHSSTTGVLRSK